MKNALFFLFVLFVEGVFMESVSVMEGDSVTLHAGLPEIKKYDVIDWRVKGSLIVRLNTKANTTTFKNVPFKDRYKLNYQTGDLIITNINTEQTGEYEVSDTIYFNKKFNVTVFAGERQLVSVMEGDSVTLYTDVTETQKYDEIRWRFRGSPIAEINRNSNNIPKYYGTFRNQLQLDCLTGSLTFKHTEKSHSGGYEVDIIRSGHTIHKSFTVTVTVSGKKTTQSESVKAGESLTLYTGLTVIQSYDFILWKTRNTDLAEIYKAEGRLKTYDGPDESFRGRLKLDHQTGDLTITNTKTTDSGLYELHITSSRHVIHKRFSVVATAPGLSPAVIAVIVVLSLLVPAAVVAAGVIYYRRRISTIKRQTHEAKTETVTAGNSVTLHTGVSGLQSTDVVMWLFGDQDNLIARITGGGNPISNLDERFRDRLQLNNQSGSLTIMKTTVTDSGRYKVKIDESGIHTSQLFILSVINPTPNEVNEREETRTPFISQP